MEIRLNALRKLAANMKKLDGNKLLHQVLDNSSIQHDILDLNRQDQLYEKGITADGVTLGQYSPFTLQEKSKKGQRTDHITLYDTGKFYGTFRFANRGKQFVISADTLKGATFYVPIKGASGATRKERETDLMEYGRILGLTQHNLAIVAGWVRAPLVEKITNAILKT